jgi:hypothetical protein
MEEFTDEETNVDIVIKGPGSPDEYEIESVL